MFRSVGLSLLVGALLVGCGSPAPSSPVPKPTPKPTPGPTPSPTPDNALFPPRDYVAALPFDAPPADAATRGQWSQLVKWPTLTIHANLLPDGELLTFGGNYYPGYKTGDPYSNTVDLWNPVTNTHQDISYISTSKSIFCGGHVLLPDGRLLINGGDDLDKLNGSTYSALAGVRQTRTYDYKTKSWDTAGDMAEKRWYPTSTNLPNGEVLTLSGTRENGNDYSDLPEVFNPQTGSWRSLTGARATTELYPRMFVLSDGRVINTGGQSHNVLYGNDFITGILDPSGSGKWYPFERDGDNFRRDYGPAVMYDTDKIVYFGGGGDATNGNTLPPSADTLVIDAAKIDPTTGKGGTRFTTPMPYGGRRMHNATLLPDGSVLITGGTSAYGFTNRTYQNYDPQVKTDPSLLGRDATRKETLLWDPATEQYQTLAPMTRERLYHSVGILLPDATVLVGGTGSCDQCNYAYDTYQDVQVFKPPYLFKGPRPSIKSVPREVAYQQTFTVQTDDAANITAVNLIHLGNVTHSFNMGQRINTLTFTKASGSLNVTAPANANLAPPGQYMLFILRSGVPSVSRIVTLK